jgi:signal transduction histidine kinase
MPPNSSAEKTKNKETGRSQEATTPLESTGKLVRVLMIEDDEYYSTFVRRLLTRCAQPRFDLVRAGNLAEASQYLSWEAPDVILLDLGLTDSNGLTTLSSVRELAGIIPIVVLTGRDAEETGLQAVGLGAQDYLVKHEIGNNSLIRCIRYAIERRKFEESTLRLAAIRDFMATLAHDLKVPLIGANTVFDALLSGQFGELPPEQAKVLYDLQKNNKEQLSLVQKLLEVYRYEIGAPCLEFARLDIKRLISQCIVDVSARYSPVHPVAMFLPENLPRVIGDEDALRRLFTHLLDNAMKYSSGVGEVRIHTELAGAKLCVYVHNSGSTIPTEVQSGRFQKFWQGVPGKSYVAHTGVGLYLCQRIASLHRGRIICDSTREGGTTSKVILPVASPA